MTPKPNYTACSQLVYAIAELTQQHGRPPTFRELQSHLDLASGTLTGRVRTLRKFGVLTHGDGHSRTLRLVAPELYKVVPRR